jgi:hypothetical protein
MRRSVRLVVSMVGLTALMACTSESADGGAVVDAPPRGGALDGLEDGNAEGDHDHGRLDEDAVNGGGTDEDIAPPTKPGVPLPLLAPGLHPRASDALRAAGVTASRIVQTIGSAAASAGTHASDGTVDGKAYTAAVDLRTKDLTQAQILALSSALATNGYAAYYRWPGHDGWPASEAPHIHAVYAGCAMKRSLRDQIHDWLAGKNGLASHTAYTFFTPTQAMENTVRALFLANNPTNG